MKFLKALLVIAGLIGLIVGAVYLANTYVTLMTLTNVANANNSKQPFVNPFNNVALQLGLGALGGLLLGLGLGLPSRTAGQIRHKALADHAAETTVVTTDDRRL